MQGRAVGGHWPDDAGQSGPRHARQATAGYHPAVSVDRDLLAKMPDGVDLLADRWYPTGTMTGSPPVILLRTPYGRRQWGMLGRLFAERGYQVVIQSCRGTFGSGGDWVPMRNEADDGRETLGWIADQPWFDGKLATFGPSYLGLTQWAIAQDPPSCLKAVARDVTASNFRDAVVYPSNSFALETALTWLHQVEYQEFGWMKVLGAQLASRRTLRAASGVLPVADADAAAVGRHVRFFQDWIVHENPGDTWWDPIDFGRQLEAVPPASLVGGWYDIFLPCQLDDYRALRAAGRSATLTIGPWSHVSPGVLAASLRDALKLFDDQLGDNPSRFPRNMVRIFVMGARRWVELADWPPPFEEQPWYLGPGGKLHARCLGHRARPLPVRPGRSNTRDRRTLAQLGKCGAEGSAKAGRPTRRPHLHERGPHRGSYGGRAAQRRPPRAVDARAHGFLRPPV